MVLRYRIQYVEPDGDVDDDTGRWLYFGDHIRIVVEEDGYEVERYNCLQPTREDDDEGARECVDFIDLSEQQVEGTRDA